MLCGVGVGVDRKQRAASQGRLDVDVAQVQTNVVGVDLQGHVAFSGGQHEGRDVRAEAFAPVDHPARGMAEDVDQRVTDGP